MARNAIIVPREDSHRTSVVSARTRTVPAAMVAMTSEALPRMKSTAASSARRGLDAGPDALPPPKPPSGLNGTGDPPSPHSARKAMNPNANHLPMSKGLKRNRVTCSSARSIAPSTRSGPAREGSPPAPKGAADVWANGAGGAYGLNPEGAEGTPPLYTSSAMSDEHSAFRTVPRTGVIYVTTEAQKRVFSSTD